MLRFCLLVLFLSVWFDVLCEDGLVELCDGGLQEGKLVLGRVVLWRGQR